MLKSYDVWFASSNRHKYLEAEAILEKSGIGLGFFKFDPVEIQSESISDIARQKALDAYALCKKPVIVEDVGLFIKGLNGFPGPYSSYVFKTIGNSGVARLVGVDRRAQFLSVMAFCDRAKRPVLFEGTTRGTISKRPRGRGWGYDPIFVPSGRQKTYAQIQDKNAISHRSRALAKFASWFTGRRQSGGR